MFYIEKIARRNSKTFVPKITLNHIEDVIFYMEANKLSVAGYPYIFTHIALSDGSRITQKVTMADGREIMCSPTKLREALESIKV